MYRTKMMFLAAAMAASAVCGVVYAQEAASPTVEFKATADMPSLIDKSKKDTFKVTLTDRQVVTDLSIECVQGDTKALFLRRARACKVGGVGTLIAPSGQRLQRAQYMGGYQVDKTGQANANDMSVNYLAVGAIEASHTPFSGSLNLKPELTSSGAQALADNVLRKVSEKAGTTSVLDKRVDTVDFNGLYIPSAGLRSDKGCTWNGNMVFAYQTNSWYLDMLATCSGKEYKLKGNMPWTDSPGKTNQTQYDLTLTLPRGGSGNDDALFAAAGNDADLFAKADGITAQIVMKQSRMVKVKVDGVLTDNPSLVDATGTFTGNKVPMETVRSLSVLFGILSQSLFGA